MSATLAAAWKRYGDRPTRRTLAIDAAVALVVFALGVVFVFSGGLGEPSPGTRAGDALGVVLVLAVALPLAARSVNPGLALALSTAAVVPLVLLRYPGEMANAPLLALYSLASVAGRDRRAARAAMALAAGAWGAVATSFALVHLEGFPAPEIVTEGLIWLAVWIAGDRARLRRERMAELEERALRAERDAERERRLAAAEERTRIARELHDSAGHAMNVILVQAGAARLLRERDPERSRAALETIEQVARGTIGEIDRLVHALREEGAPAGAAADPPPGVDGIDRLAARHRDAGLAVATRVEGAPRPLAAGVDRSAYRIVQEALTNAARHGDGGADVVVRYAPRELEITVKNPLAPNGPVRPGGGHGIVGMRERASLLGGSLEAGREDGAFVVRARLPYGAEGE